METSRQTEMTRLGLLGLTPFVAGAAAVWLSPWALPQHVGLDFHRFALVYGGIIVAYLSGIGAGAMLTPSLRETRSFLPGMIIALAAFVAILPNGTFFFSLGAAQRHGLILLLLIYLLVRDLSAARAGLTPAWYGRLRVRLTLWAGASIGLIILRLVTWGQY